MSRAWDTDISQCNAKIGETSADAKRLQLTRISCSVNTSCSVRDKPPLAAPHVGRVPKAPGVHGSKSAVTAATRASAGHPDQIGCHQTNIFGGPIMNTSAQAAVPLVTLDLGQFADLLRMSRAGLSSAICRNPARYPAPLLTGGRHRVWLWCDVMAWLESKRAAPASTPAQPASRRSAKTLPTPLPRRRGRPTKVEQLARAREQEAVAQK